MNIPENFLEDIQDNPSRVAFDICEYVLTVVDGEQGWNRSIHELLQECYALIVALDEAQLIKFDFYLSDASDEDLGTACGIMAGGIAQVRDALEKELSSHRFDSLKKKFAGIVTKTFSYEFTDGDVSRIQTLINELRQLITDNTELEDQHKRRLLKRLEKLQSEMHKKMSDLDHFYGLTVEGSVMLKKVGGNLKPIVDRISEITKITWATQSRAEDLPSGSEPPLLGHEGDPHSLK